MTKESLALCVCICREKEKEMIRGCERADKPIEEDRSNIENQNKVNIYLTNFR